MLRGRSSESTTPLMKPKYSGMSSSQSSMMKTLLTQSLMLFFFFLVSNMSKGALLGTQIMDLNSKLPSAENSLTARWSSQSLVRLLQKLAYYYLVTSSGFFIQIGLFLFSSSSSVETSLIFFFFLSFSFSSSLISTSSFFSSFFSSSSSSEIYFSVVFSTWRQMGKEMNSECFLTRSLSFLSSRNSTLSGLMVKMTLDPLLRSSLSSSTTEKVPPAVDSHLCWCSSPGALEMTVTLSATRKAEQKPTPNWPIMEISAPWERASMKALVPDLAMVPRLVISSCLVIPIPVSRRIRVLVALSGMISILKLGSSWIISGSVRDLYLILSRASEALEINSLRKISLLVQKVLMMRPINCWISALKAKCQTPAFQAMDCNI